MKDNSDALDITSIDPGSLTPEQKSALMQWAIRRAHAERSLAIAAMWGHAGSWMRRAASALVSRAKAPAMQARAVHHQA